MKTFFNKLVKIAGQMKGFLGFSAFVFLVITALFSWLFSAGSFDELVKNIKILDKTQFFLFVMTALVLVFLLIILLVVLSYRSKWLEPGIKNQSFVIYIVVHELGDKTALIEDAEVTLALPEPVKKKTSEMGGANFTIPGPLLDQKVKISARKAGFKTGKPLDIKLCKNANLFIPLEGAVDSPGKDLEVRVWAQYYTDARNKRDISAIPRGDGRHAFSVGDHVILGFQAGRDCYMTLINEGTSGKLAVLYPNQYGSSGPGAVKGGVTYWFPDPGHGFEFKIDGPPGDEVIWAVAAEQPLWQQKTPPETEKDIKQLLKSGVSRARCVIEVQDR
jgi:hypothetical protein